MPKGYVPIGDAICSLDPTFGQGMSVAALQAVALRESLSTARSTEVARSYLARATRIVDRAWTITAGADLQLPGVHGTTKPTPRIIARYLRQVQTVAQHDRAIAAKFLRVTNLLSPPSTLLSLSTVVGVLRSRRRSPVG